MNIVCSEHSLAIQPEQVSPEKELVLEIMSITNFPGYRQGTESDTEENLKGPYAGGDIAVYHISAESKEKAKRGMKQGNLSPACLPEKNYESDMGIFAGWLDQEPFYRPSTSNIETYEREYQTLRTVQVRIITDYLEPFTCSCCIFCYQVEKTECKDPEWMNTTTFYPAGTECYKDPSQASCFSFGNSGSGVLRKITEKGEERYAFAGPLSMTKSCDSVYIFDNLISYSSGNPGVFTDAYCYLPWIAAMYGMKMPEDYKRKPSCGEAKGNRAVINESKCLGQDAENLDRGRCQDWQNQNYQSEYECQQDLLINGTVNSGAELELEGPRECDFDNHNYTKNGLNIPWNQCMLEAREGYAYNIYLCKVFAIFMFLDIVL